MRILTMGLRDLAIMNNRSFILANSILVTFLLTVVSGCGEGDVYQPVAAPLLHSHPMSVPPLRIVPALNEQMLTADDVTMVQLAGGEEEPSEKKNTVQRESIEVKPYTGPPIYLPESDPPPPATVVESKRKITQEFAGGGGLHIERQVTRYSDERIVNDGIYKEFFPSGQKFVEGNYLQGEQHGTWTYWYENGQLCREVTYDHGVPNGSWEVFRPDGSLLAERTFNAGRRHGKWVEYAADGEQTRRVTNYLDGKPHGEYKDWYPTGAEKSVRTFKNGLRDGLSKEWDQEGNPRLEANYKEGKLHGDVVQWSSEGEKLVQRYADGRLIAEDN